MNLAEPAPVLFFVAAFSRHDQALEWARDRLVSVWGPVAHEAGPFPFDQTDYYQRTMGAELRKGLWSFSRRGDPGTLPERKRQAIAWEQEYAGHGHHPEIRPLNLDPGYVTAAKVVLATTKDRDHRLYLGQGIYGEVTLSYRDEQWRTSRWTYPDYALPEYHRFFVACREDLRHWPEQGRPE